MSSTHHIAIDLGAESGRVILGTINQDRLVLQEILRFPTKTEIQSNHFHWDLEALTDSILEGVEKAARMSASISSLSADSWALDYVMLDEQGKPLGLPFCYRDSRTKDSIDRLLIKIGWPEIYAETGIQLMAINTLFQFEAEIMDSSSALGQAKQFLSIADYFNYLFSGVKVVDQSQASATQIFNSTTKKWSQKLITTLGLPESYFPKIVPSASVLGKLLHPKWKNSKTLSEAKVIATCSHDTAAAVAAVPANSGENWAYISSGTWSLLGVELKSPILTDAARDAGFTNEMGLGETIRFLKNIIGLWIMQECRRAFEAKGQSLTYEELTQMAFAEPAVAHLSLEDPRFLIPGNMPEKIMAFCRETGQSIPDSPGSFMRTVLESLALTYARELRRLEEIIGKKIDKIYIVGGGSRNRLLNQLTADATGLPVVAGPAEATAIGNILIQGLALGPVRSANHLRKIVSTSFSTTLFEPTEFFTRNVTQRFANLCPQHGS